MKLARIRPGPQDADRIGRVAGRGRNSGWGVKSAKFILNLEVSRRSRVGELGVEVASSGSRSDVGSGRGSGRLTYWRVHFTSSLRYVCSTYRGCDPSDPYESYWMLPGNECYVMVLCALACSSSVEMYLEKPTSWPLDDEHALAQLASVSRSQ